MADNGIAVFPTNPDEGVAVFEDGTKTPSLSPEVANDRASKAAIGTGGNIDEFRTAILNGNEDRERERVARLEDLKQTQFKQQTAIDYIKEKQKRGLPVTPDDFYLVSQMTTLTPNNKDTIFEKLFAKTITSHVEDNPSSASARLAKDSSILADNVTESFRSIVTNQQYAIKLLQDLEAEMANDSYLSSFLDHAARMVPGLSWYRQENALKNLPSSGSFLLGNNLEEQIRSYYLMGEQGPQALKETVNILKEKNHVEAADYLKNFISFTSNDQLMANFLSITDLTMAAPAPLGLMPKVKNLISAATVAKNVIKALAVRSPSASQIAEATGEIAQAALDRTWKETSQMAGGTGKGLDQLKESVPSLANPQALLDGSTVFSQNFKNNLQTTLERQAIELVDGTLKNPINIERLKPGTPAFEQALDNAREVLRQARPEINGAVLDSGWRHDPITNTDWLTTRIGTTTAEMFDTEAEAILMADKFYKLRDYKISQQGNKYHLTVETPIDETSDAVRNLLIQTDNQTPNSLINRMFGFARMADSVLPDEIVKEGKAAMYGSSQITSLIRANAKSIAALKSDERKALTAFTERQRDYIDKETKLRGKFSKSLGEFESEWMTQFGRSPSEREATAYFTYTQISDTDWLARNVQQYLIDNRIGLQMWHLPMDGVDKVTPIKGKLVKDIDWQAGDTGLIVWSDHKDDIRNLRTAYIQSEKNRESSIALNTKIKESNTQAKLDAAKEGLSEAPQAKLRPESPYSKEEIKDMISSNKYKLIQLTPEGEKSLRELPGMAETLPKGRISYVLSRNAEFSNVPFQQVNYRPGGHVAYSEGYFVRQPHVVQTKRGEQVTTNYYGDKNVFHFESEADSKYWVSKLDEGRKVFLNETEEAQAAWTKSNLPKGVSLDKLFGKNGEFDPHVPFLYSKKGVSLDDAHKLDNLFPGYQSSKADPFNPYNGSPFNSFTQERDKPLMSITRETVDGNPVFSLRRGSLINPIETMQDAALQVMNGKYLGDLKIKYAEHFISEFAPILKASTDDLKNNPFHALFKGEFKDRADPELLALAKNFRRTAIQFFGLKSDFERQVDSLRQKVIDGIYSKVGADGLNKLERIVNVLDVGGVITDPVRFMRGYAFHTKLGMFNPVQLYLQAAGIVHVAGIEGIDKAMKAGPAQLLMRAALFNPDHLDHVAKLASKFGWSTKDFKESFEALKRSGFANVANEHALMDDFLNPQVVRTKMGEVLDSGSMFFKEGERTSRMMAWNAAYLRWKEVNPGKVFNDAAVKEVLARADMNTMSMSRFSNAGYQNGILSVPTQFFAYQTHMAELLLGKKLTTQEKTRLFVTNSMIYGVPVAVGANVGVWPMHETIKKWALENGQRPDDNLLANVTAHGIPAVVGELLLGTKYNIGERYGPGGLGQIKEFLTGEKGAEIFLGASGSAGKETLKAMMPLGHWLVSPFLSEDKALPLKYQDFVAAAQTVSSVSNFMRGWNAAAYGEYMTKNGVRLETEPAGVAGGIFSALTGLQPQSIVDAYAMIESNVDIKNIRKDAEKDAGRWYRLALEAGKNGDTEQAADFLRRTKIALIPGRYLPTEMNKVLQRILSEHGTLVDNVEKEFAKQTPERQKAYIDRLQRLETKKGQ